MNKPLYILTTLIIISLLFFSSYTILSHSNLNSPKIPILNNHNHNYTEIVNSTGQYYIVGNQTYYYPFIHQNTTIQNMYKQKYSQIVSNIHYYSYTNQYGKLDEFAYFNTSLYGFQGNANYFACELDFGTTLNNYQNYQFQIYSFFGVTTNTTIQIVQNGTGTAFASNTQWYIYWSGISFNSNLAFSPRTSANTIPSQSALSFTPASYGLTIINQSSGSTKNDLNTYSFDVSYTPNVSNYPIVFGSSKVFNVSVNNENVYNTKNTTVELPNGSYIVKYTINGTEYTTYVVVDGSGEFVNLNTLGYGISVTTEAYIFIIMLFAYILLFSRYATPSLAVIGTLGLYWLYAGYKLGIEFFTLNTFVLIAFLISMFIGYKFYSGDI